VANMSQSKVHREDIGTMVLFLFVIFTLGTLSAWNCFNSRNTSALIENRMTAPLPKLQLRSQSLLHFPVAFSAFFDDRFAYRENLISLVNYLCYKAFSVSNSPSVVVGNHGWLFFLDHGDRETARHYPLFAKRELEAWRRALEGRQAWLAARNSKFLFVVAPSKCSIYSEELPKAYQPVSVRSRQDQLIDYLRTNSTVNVIDLRQPLIEAKRFARLYHQTDTHWNTVGGYIGYTKIAERLVKWFPQIRPITFADLKVDTYKFAEGDLQNMMGLHGLIPEIVLRSLPKQQASWRECKINTNGQSQVTLAPVAPYASEMDDKNLPTAFCLRDSFMAYIEPFLSTHFRRIAYYWQQEFPDTIIEREKPDVVIEELVERELFEFYPHDSPAVEQALDGEFFAKNIDKCKLAGTAAMKIQ
jgi:alginate O-acetyltransferase complex protein AlgJ